MGAICSKGSDEDGKCKYPVRLSNQIVHEELELNEETTGLTAAELARLEQDMKAVREHDPWYKRSDEEDVRVVDK